MDDTPTCLLVCTGKDCRSDKGFADMMAMAGERPGSLQVPCQGLCHGPIVGLQRGTAVRWFSKVRSPKLRKAVAKTLRTQHVPKSLRKHEHRKRRDRIRGERRMRAIDGVAVDVLSGRR